MWEAEPNADPSAPTAAGESTRQLIAQIVRVHMAGSTPSSPRPTTQTKRRPLPRPPTRSPPTFATEPPKRRPLPRPAMRHPTTWEVEHGWPWKTTSTTCEAEPSAEATSAKPRPTTEATSGETKPRDQTPPILRQRRRECERTGWQAASASASSSTARPTAASTPSVSAPPTSAPLMSASASASTSAPIERSSKRSSP